MSSEESKNMKVTINCMLVKQFIFIKLVFKSVFEFATAKAASYINLTVSHSSLMRRANIQQKYYMLFFINFKNLSIITLLVC